MFVLSSQRPTKHSRLLETGEQECIFLRKEESIPAITNQKRIMEGKIPSERVIPSLDVRQTSNSLKWLLFPRKSGAQTVTCFCCYCHLLFNNLAGRSLKWLVLVVCNNFHQQITAEGILAADIYCNAILDQGTKTRRGYKGKNVHFKFTILIMEKKSMRK